MKLPTLVPLLLIAFLAGAVLDRALIYQRMQAGSWEGSAQDDEAVRLAAFADTLEAVAHRRVMEAWDLRLENRMLKRYAGEKAGSTAAEVCADTVSASGWPLGARRLRMGGRWVDVGAPHVSSSTVGVSGREEESYAGDPWWVR